MNLSEKIQLCRKRAGLSQEALAEKLNVSRQAVSKWETGAAEPELSKLRALAAAFGVTADWLLSEEDAADGNSVGVSTGAREDGAANSVSVRSDSASNTAGGPSTAPGNSCTCGDSSLSGESNASPGSGFARAKSPSNTVSGPRAASGSGSARSDSASTAASGPNTATGSGFACGDSGLSGESNASPGSGFARANSTSNTVGGPRAAVGSGFTFRDSGLNNESNGAPGDGSAANADGFCKSSAESDSFTDGDSTDKGSSGQGEGQADTASGASAHQEESSASNASAGGQTASGGRADFHSASPSPNWVESVPGVLGRLLRQYGWIIGLRMAVSGALMTFIGFLGRAAVRSMDQSFGLGFEMVPSQTAWYDEAGNLMTSPVSMPSQPSDPMTILCTGMIVLGVILILAGICIAVSLRNQHRE